MAPELGGRALAPEVVAWKSAVGHKARAPAPEAWVLKQAVERTVLAQAPEIWAEGAPECSRGFLHRFRRTYALEYHVGTLAIRDLPNALPNRDS